MDDRNISSRLMPRRFSSMCAWVLVLMLALLSPLAAQAQTTIEYIHTDALGSPVAVTDASGNIVEREVYEPYGSPITRPPSDQPGFTGHVADSLTGLTYMQQRYYDPQIGRFLSVDPVTAYSNPVGAFNRYWYANNNPYRFKDPDGRIIETAWDVANVAMGTASAYSNFSDGNIGAGIVDSVGVIVDAAATAIPLLPGGAGTAIKAARGAERIVDTSRAARRSAQRQAGVPTSRPATSQSGREGQRQLIVEGADGKPKAVTQHSPDKDHPNPHWHAADAKTDPISGEVRTNRHGQAKYESGGPAVEYPKKEP